MARQSKVDECNLKSWTNATCETLTVALIAARVGQPNIMSGAQPRHRRVVKRPASSNVQDHQNRDHRSGQIYFRVRRQNGVTIGNYQL
jgi:hypothetical protein